MQSDIYSGAAALESESQIQDAIAFNLANASTAGFKKRTTSTFQPLLEESLSEYGYQTALPRTQVGIDFSQGDIYKTHNPLDVALQGEGFFKVRHEGEVLYTRAGAFTVNSDGEITTQSGDPVVLAESNAPIFPSGAKIAVQKDGSIFQGQIKIGKLDVAAIDDKSLLEPLNGGLYRLDPSGRETSSDARVVGESLENSNVNPIDEFIAMVSVGRKFEAASNIIREIDQLYDRLLR